MKHSQLTKTGSGQTFYGDVTEQRRSGLCVGVAGYLPRPKVLGFDCTGGQHTGEKKTVLFHTLDAQMIILLRQALDKHRESTQKRDAFSFSYTVIDNNMKLVHNPGEGQCKFLPPYSEWKNWVRRNGETPFWSRFHHFYSLKPKICQARLGTDTGKSCEKRYCVFLQSEYGRNSNESYMFLFDLDKDYSELHNLREEQVRKKRNNRGVSF
jgi:hypothetical protein